MNGSEPDGRAGIIRFNQDGKPLRSGIIGSAPILNMYYAYGIKNIFGFDFDPVTGKMWDTENGPTFGDEINLVEPGFNSGWYSPGHMVCSVSGGTKNRTRKRGGGT